MSYKFNNVITKKPSLTLRAKIPRLLGSWLSTRMSRMRRRKMTIQLPQKTSTDTRKEIARHIR